MTAAKQYFYGCGKRKSAIAQVRLYNNGSGNITVNGKDGKEYFFGNLVENILIPLRKADSVKKFDVTVVVRGGGTVAQADAVRHGISRGLLEYDPTLRSLLKQDSLLTRDARKKERKKPGLKGARKGSQWAKR